MSTLIAKGHAPSFPVFPCHSIKDGRCTCGKDGCASPGKHPLESLVPRGHNDATRDEEKLAEWWRQKPWANFAINTTGLVVVDIDPEHGGLESLRDLEGEYGETLPETVTVETGGGGFHYYMKRPEGYQFHCRNGWRKGIDIKTDGGYVIAPPSRHEKGDYKWARGKSPEQIPIAPVPDWLLPILPQKNDAPRPEHRPAPVNGEHNTLLQRAQSYVAKAAAVGEGARNDAAFRLAGHVAAITTNGSALGESEIVALLAPWNLRNSPPLEADELRQCVASALNNGTPRAAKEPRQGMPDLRPDDLREPERQFIERLTFAELHRQHPRLKPPVIDGLLRLGETANIISYSKVGKSWMGYGLALSIITGRPWLNRFATAPGKVLLVDNELHACTIANRIPAVAGEMQIHPDEYEHSFDVVSLRGRLCSFADLVDGFDIRAGEYQAILLDAKYRFSIAGVSENDNAAETQFYNMVDQFAERTGAAVILIHHASKGSQSDKRVTDVGAGAGSQSRAADCHLVLREHEEPGIVVLEAAVRSFAPAEPLALQWVFPLWLPTAGIDTSLLKGRLSARQQQQAEADVAGMEATETALKQGTAGFNELCRRTGFGKDKQRRLVNKLCADGKVLFTEKDSEGNKCHQYTLIQTA